MAKNLFSIAIIAILAFTTSCNTASNTPSAQTTASTSDVNAKIVYVNIDTLVNNYNMYTDLNGDFTKRANAAQVEMEKKATAFQKKLQSYETKIKNGLVTRTEAMKMEQEVQKEQQELVTYRDSVMQSLAEEEQVMINKIKFNINEFINKYNDTKKYDLILSHSAASGLIMAGNPELDITDKIILGLNAEYVPAKK